MDSDIREQLFDLSRKLKKAEDGILKSSMSARNKKTLEGHKNYLLSRMSKARATRHLYCCKTMAELYDKDFLDYTKEDCTHVVNLLQESSKNYKANTLNDFVGTIQMLFKFIDNINGKVQSPRCMHLIRKKVENKLSKKDLVSEDDLNKLLAAAPTLQYKCILSLIYESAARPHEVRAIRLKDITKIERGYRIVVCGKGKQHYLFSMTSAPLITEWLQSRAYKEPDMPLFYMLKNDVPCFYKHHTWATMLARLSIRVLGRRINLYRFRHTRAYHFLEMGIPTAKIKAVMGHSPGSDTLERTYLHLDDTDIENTYCTAAGVIQPKQQKESAFVVKTCKCGVQIAPYMNVCEKCGSREDPAKWALPEEKNRFNTNAFSLEEKAYMLETMKQLMKDMLSGKV